MFMFYVYACYGFLLRLLKYSLRHSNTIRFYAGGFAATFIYDTATGV
jgi:hypothetical protein